MKKEEREKKNFDFDTNAVLTVATNKIDAHYFSTSLCTSSKCSVKYMTDFHINDKTLMNFKPFEAKVFHHFINNNPKNLSQNTRKLYALGTRIFINLCQHFQ